MPSSIVNVEDPEFQPDGTGVGNAFAALQAAFNAAENGVLLFPDASKTYAFDEALTIRPNTRIINAGAKLAARVTPAKTAIDCGPGLRADLLRIRVPAPSLVSPALVLGSDTTIERLEIEADRQQANRDLGKFGLRVLGSNIKLGYVSVKRFDNAVVVEDALHVVIQRIDIRSYAKGLYLSRCHYLELMSGVIHTATLTKLGDRDDHGTVAGMNGLLIADSSHLVISDLIVDDSIEHGIRIGGELETWRCTFNNIQVSRAGGCGMKIQPAEWKKETLPAGVAREMGDTATAIQINGLMVLDCAPPLAGHDELDRFKEGSRNRSGLRLERVHNVVVNGLQVGRRENQRYSAYHGLCIVRCKNVTVNAPQITDTYSAGIVLWDGTRKASDDSPSLAVNEIYIRDPAVTFLAPNAHPTGIDPADGILIASPTEILRNIVITGCYVRGHTGYGVRIQPPFAGGVRWPVILQGWVKDEDGGGGWYHEDYGDRDIHREGLLPV